MVIPTFETERLLLKPISLDDVEGYEKGFVDYDVIRHLAAHVPWPYPVGGVQDFMENHLLPHQGKSKWCWGIFLRTDQKNLIGSIEIRLSTTDNRGFWLAKKYWGKGYMTEAVDPVMAYAFEELNFEKMVFTNAKGNQRSRRIKEKTGAKFIGLKSAKFTDPQYTDSEVWELTKACWDSSHVERPCN